MFASSAFGVIRNKWLAINLETSGLGVLAQIASGQNWLGTLAGLGLSLPVARAVGASGASGDATLARSTVWTALTLAGLASLGVACAGLLFAGTISEILLGSREHALLVRISLFGVVGIALQTVFIGLFAGRSDLRANLTMAIVGGTAAVAVTLALVPRFGLTGGVLGAAVLAPATVAAALFASRRTCADMIAPKPAKPLDPVLARSILGVGTAALALSLVDLGVMLSIRAHYLRVNGLGANGLLQAALSLAQQVGSLFYAYLSNYAFGKVSAAAGAAGLPEVRAYTRRQWTPLVLLAAGITAAAMVAATPLLHILYSRRFDAARGLMAWALVGEFLRVGMNAWAVGALPIGGAKLWLPIGLLPSIGLALSYLALSGAGLGALSVPIAYVGAGSFSLCLGGIAMSRAGVTISRRDIGVVVVCAIGLAALAFQLTR